MKNNSIIDYIKHVKALEHYRGLDSISVPKPIFEELCEKYSPADQLAARDAVIEEAVNTLKYLSMTGCAISKVTLAKIEALKCP